METIANGMNLAEIAAFFTSIALTAVLVNVVRLVLTRMDTKTRTHYWLMLTGYMSFSMIRILVRSLQFLSPEENLIIDCISQLLFVLYLLFYIHKSYMKRQETE